MIDDTDTSDEPGKVTDERSLRRRIKDAIICQTLAPSQKITELGVAEKFGTSRTVARTLIEQLVAQNFLVSVSARITRVAPLTVLSIKENFLLRRMLMPELVAMSIPYVDYDEITRLNDSIAEAKVNCNDNGEILELLRKNRDHNLTLIANIKFPLPLDWLNMLEDMAMRIYWLYVRQHGELPFTPTNHAMLVEAMKQDDADRTRAIVLEILEQNEDRILNAIFSNDSYFSHDLVG